MDIDLNEKQSEVFNKVIGEDGYIKKDSPREVAFFGGFRCGKSFLCSLIIFLICSNYPKTEALICRHTYGELKDSSIAQFKDSFPPEKYKYKYKVADRECIFKNGSRISFRAFSDDASKIKSSSYDVALLVQAEELPHELFLQVLGRLSGKAIPKPLLFTEGNPSDSWCKERYADKSKEELEDQGILFVEGTTYDNEDNIPKDYIKTLLDQYPEDFVDKYVLGNWNKTSDRVFTAIQDHHKIRPFKIHTYYYKVVGFDHGMVNDSAMVWLAKDEFGKTYVFDEWHKKKASLKDIYIAARKYGNIPIIADFSMKTKDRDFGSTWNDLKRMGLNLIECTKDKKANILQVNQAFHQNRLSFFENCSYTWEQHKRYRYKRQRNSAENRKDDVIKKDDHSVDALMYGFRYLNAIQVKSPRGFSSQPRGPSLKDWVEGNV